MASAGHTGSARLDESKQPLAEEELRKMHAYWRAANYLSVGQIYLYANPLLHEPLKFEHIKPRLHGYPWLIHRLTYRRTNHDNFHVRRYKEEGTTTTPFDMTVLNDLDRFHLAGDVVDRVPRLQRAGAHFKQFLRNKLVEHKQYICEHGDDLPEIGDWKWLIRP
jgi:phosphoketolase